LTVKTFTCKPVGHRYLQPDPACPGLRRHAAEALLAALGCLLLLVPFSYVLALTARTHASVARALLRPPEDPLAQAKDLLQRPGPLPSLFAQSSIACISRLGSALCRKGEQSLGHGSLAPQPDAHS